MPGLARVQEDSLVCPILLCNSKRAARCLASSLIRFEAFLLANLSIWPRCFRQPLISLKYQVAIGHGSSHLATSAVAHIPYPQLVLFSVLSFRLFCFPLHQQLAGVWALNTRPDTLHCQNLPFFLLRQAPAVLMPILSTIEEVTLS